jgi:hypothetical protein
MTARPADDYDPDDPVEILLVLPARFHGAVPGRVRRWGRRRPAAGAVQAASPPAAAVAAERGRLLRSGIWGHAPGSGGSGARLNVSRLAAAALAEELDRRAKIAELDGYLADLDAEFGPVPQQELRAVREWADAVLPASQGDRAQEARSA